MAISTKSFRSQQYKNNETVIDAFVYDDKSKVYKTTLSGSSADLFTSKTNKFAESGLVMLVCTVALNFKFGSSLVTATAADYFLPANTPFVCAVDDASPYLSAIAASGDVYVYEIF